MNRLLFIASLVAMLACGASRAAADLPPPGEDSSKEISAARKLQSDADRLGEELTVKMLELEVAFHKRKAPVLKERNQLLKSIPNFWATIITRHPNNRGWLHADDEQILKSLIDVEIIDLAREEGSFYPLHTYRLAMRFGPNDYFTNTLLYRDIKGSVDDGQDVSGVNWMQSKIPSEASFFNFFEKNIPEVRGKLHDSTRHEIAHVFRYEFWQNPFTYYDQPSYHDYQHLAEEQYQQYEARMFAELEQQEHEVHTHQEQQQQQQQAPEDEGDF